MIPLPLISGFGAFVPPHTVTNQDLEKLVDTTSEWITTRTGIETRHKVADGVMGSDLAFEAATKALQNAGIAPSAVTHIVYCTCTADASCPPAACILAHKLGIKGATAFDLNAACTGFLAGLDIAKGIAAVAPHATILLVASETLSHRCNWEDRGTCVLFGDGAGAIIMQGNTAKETNAPKGLQGHLVDTCLSSDGELGELLVIGGGFSGIAYKKGDVIGPEYFIQMQGREVFKHAVRSMTSICNEVLTKNNMTIDDIDVFIPHQANLRIIEAVGSRLNVPAEKVFVNVQKYGNTSAASIPIALAEAIEAGAINAGSKVLFTSFGGGFTWGSAIVQF